MINTFMKKYGIIKKCKHCGCEFETRPRYLDYCSTPCKNPNNRPGHIPWNKGKKMTEEFINTKMNLEGLQKGWGWNKGIPLKEHNPIVYEKMLGESNPNWEGKVNNERYKDHIADESFKSYKREVRKATYRSVYQMKKEGLVPENTGKRKDQYQLDHIIPIKQGYEQDIDPKLLGSIPNLQYILGEENRKKWDSFQDEVVVESILKEAENVLQRKGPRPL
jgi:5-methylcytosine-specific restriction endonuclease McrA